MKKIKFWQRIFLVGVLLTIFGLGVPQIVILSSARNRILQLSDITPAPIALVFGASVIGNQTPSDTLRDRIISAVELYNSKKVDKLLMSGDNSRVEYNEVQVMKNTALELGIPEQDIVLDYAGFRTFDSCARAQKIFGVDSAILVTQQFHLPRALYLCKKFGISAVGYAADKRQYQKEDFNNFREFFARTHAFFEVNLFPHDPKFLGPQVQIFPLEKQ